MNSPHTSVRSGLSSNGSFDTDTQRHCATAHSGELTRRAAMPLGAGQLR
jgi:hypothetical protein